MWVTLGTKLAAYWAENSSKVIVMGVITVITLSILGYGYYKIDQGGYQRAKAECQEDENKIRADGDKLMKQRQQEHDLELKQNTDMYIGAIKQYAKNNDDLKRELDANLNKRLYVRAKCPTSDRNEVSTGSKVSRGDNERGQGTGWAELGSEDSQAVWRTANEVERLVGVCSQALHFIEAHGMVE